MRGRFLTNILGNRDGEVLNNPDSFKTKQESKLGVLDYILQPHLYLSLFGDLYHKVRINYYPPRGDKKELGQHRHDMTASWDIFGDEQKAADGGASGIGLLVVRASVVGQFTQALLDEKNQLEGSGGRIGSVHWSNLGDREADLACRWLNRFFQGPLLFFVYIPVGEDVGSQPRLKLVKQAIEQLEADPCVPAGGLDRGRTTLHLDYDNRDARELHLQLVRGFGLQRAFHWSDHDSVLLQLSDLLLGISERERSGRVCAESRREARKNKVFECAREKADYYSARGKDNWVFCYEPTGGLRRLLV